MRIKAIILSLLLSFIAAFGIVPVSAESADYTVGEVAGLVDGIIAYKVGQDGSGSVQGWINGGLVSGAGTVSEWYVIALSQYGNYDFAPYETSLFTYLGTHGSAAASSKQKYALALCAAGSGDRYISDILNDSIGGQGIMSWIYGLHVLNNGYTCTDYSENRVIEIIMSMQLADGGWALFGDRGDVDVTAMAVTALAPHYSGNSVVQEACERGIGFLSEKQEDDGGYQSMGMKNPESAAQVLTALSALGIDCMTDGRFVKNGNTVIDGIERYRLPDGGYSHTEGGGYNENATSQAFYGYVAYVRMSRGQSPLFVLDNRQPQNTVTDTPTASEQGEPQQTSAAENASAPTAATAVGSSAAAVSSTSGTAVSETTAAQATVSSSRTTVTSKAASASGSVSTGMSGEADENAQLSEKAERSGYKPIAIVIIISTALLASLVIFVMGKRNYKNFIFVGIFAAAGIAAVLLTDIKSKETYYSGEVSHKENAAGTVTMTIRCDTIAGKTDFDYVPDDGIILDVTEFEIEDGDTAYDVLTEAAQTYGIQIDNRGGESTAYIAGINYIYEYDFGDLSGWVFHVNGVSVSRGCGDYELSDGDVIEWLYTCETGRDLDEVYEK